MQNAPTSLGKVAAGWVPWEADSEKFMHRMLSKEGPRCLGWGEGGGRHGQGEKESDPQGGSAAGLALLE